MSTDILESDDIDEVEAELARQREILDQAERALGHLEHGVLAPDVEFEQRQRASIATEQISLLEYRLRELRRGR